MQSGELIVTGKDHVTIKLHGNPSKVVVKFKDDCVLVPCNPVILDSLQWDINRSFTHHGGYDLHIKWNVSDVREIEWAVYF